ncbi:unnamed protein product [Echinostoma caproni]|uniref:SAM domain-containing protein n=1 Tax=Echinostoma caproni TaxID=27848 RepID=A0A182ZZE9_9TREM|nr:unnamed protein product [Echinostoma caproni]
MCCEGMFLMSFSCYACKISDVQSVFCNKERSSTSSAFLECNNWCRHQDQDEGSVASSLRGWDVRVFLEEFEDVAELAGIRTDRGKLTALRALLNGRAPG